MRELLIELPVFTCLKTSASVPLPVLGAVVLGGALAEAPSTGDVADGDDVVRLHLIKSRLEQLRTIRLIRCAGGYR